MRVISETNNELWHHGRTHAKIRAMPAAQLSHPDRLATTLATLQAARSSRNSGDFAPIGNGSADCRIELKMAQWHALRAAAASPAAAEHLAGYDRKDFPELWAGTVQDGVARGFQVRLEEVSSLAPAELMPGTPAATSDQDRSGEPAPTGKRTEFTGKDLRRKKDILIASAGSRVRFSRKGGLLFVDREHDVNSENCLWFEGRRDTGSLDGFAGADDERARLFSCQFLKPRRFLQSKHYCELELVGRLGRGAIGWPCRVVLIGDTNAPDLKLTIELGATVPGWRLRSRFLGVPEQLVHHHCMPVREQVTTEHGGFLADTLVRSCATLMVDGDPMPVPDAASPRAICHTFSLGKRPV
ncbi:MAG: hypothetical protein ACI89X_002196 [Planctomycetota bacterium]